jgi:hypothetical protein
MPFELRRLIWGPSMQAAGLSWLSVSALLATLCALQPAASAQIGRWDHAFSQSGRWEQAFRNTGSQALGHAGPLHANGYFPSGPQFSVFDTGRLVSGDFGFGYPGLPWCGGVYNPYPLVIQAPPLPLWRTSWGGTGVLYPTIPLAGSPWPEFAAVDAWICSPIAPVCCSGVWGAGPCGGVFLFPVIQSFSFRSMSVQANALPPAFDPADPRLLNFTAPPRRQIPADLAAPQEPLPGVAAQPVPEPLDPAADPAAKVQKVLADGGIVLRGKRRLADRDKGN